MTSGEIRQTFLDFFKSKEHVIVPSAPMVIKDDPTLMFTNAGMNQFKDIFLGNSPAKYKRVADTQKCIRVSGKQNDLEEVGVDTYHHTMFEMLGNWSFGDYFKKEAIAWAWELLTEVYKLPKDRLYVTVFEGDEKEGLAFDEESKNEWLKWIAAGRILNGNKKDNFWEMGDTGPCGACSEIHVDLRSDAERAAVDGKTLVNNDHPQVIEIWNNVFMEFNRKADGSLEKLPARHVDTGMGFERLCMALQGKKSNYDTDVFQPLIAFIEKASKKKYGNDEKTDIAMRVIADHIRAISFAIADGQLPSNNKAGYVIRRILRRAVRYAYTFLDFKDPFLYTIVPALSEQMGPFFPELVSQKELIMKVIREEETSFLKTLGNGLQRFEELKSKTSDAKVIPGDVAFELYDTYGFPIDLTQLLAKEKGLSVDMDGFNKFMQEQKTRSRSAATVENDDWVVINEGNGKGFVGYDKMEAGVNILRYRRSTVKGQEQFQLVLDQTPFYAESGGQVGDKGTITNSKETIKILDTKKENNLVVHFADRLPEDPAATFTAKVDLSKRLPTENNHSATHLLHAALRAVLGTHVEQKGSLVNEEYLRFDFSHFSKVTDEEISKIESLVNEKIRENISLDEKREVPIADAKKLGATALFGEKYGETVRVITFDPGYSVELCGGTHVSATGRIGLFKITSESAVAAGVRRIEAVTAKGAEQYVNQQFALLEDIRKSLKNPKDLRKSLEQLLEENSRLAKKIEGLEQEQTQLLKKELLNKIDKFDGINFIGVVVNLPSAEAAKQLSFELKNELENLFLVLGSNIAGKPQLSVMISDNLVKERGLNAGNIIRDLAKEINGGGGGQPFFATAGGTKSEGLDAAIRKARNLFQDISI
jgi:alanyl-tRNA synthetase